MSRPRLLIVDDEPLYLRTTGELLRKAGYDCLCLPDAHQAIERLEQEDFDLVLSDLNMPGNHHLELLHEHHRQRPRVPLIVITGVPSLPTAIESLRLGITDYLLKPVKFEDLLASVRRALSRAQSTPATPVPPPRDRRELPELFPAIIGRSPVMLELFDIIQRVATTDTNILITGESGTGKEVVARTIHEFSHRQHGLFQVIDCTAVPESLFESLLFGHKKGAFTGAISDQAGLLQQCDRGTAFFDELGELPLAMQAKLLRAVQEQTFTPVGSHTPVMVDTRFICATNRDLKLEVNAGRFRQDLFYRLGVIHIELPPLRTRGDDVLLLAGHFLEQLRTRHAVVTGFTDAALQALRAYSWPGNIRELRNVIERTLALARGPWIDVLDLPETIRSPELPSVPSSKSTAGDYPFLAALNDQDLDRTASSLDQAYQGASRDQFLRATEYRYLLTLMQSHRGNVSEAARQAGVSRQGLHKLLRQHGINAADYRT